MECRHFWSKVYRCASPSATGLAYRQKGEVGQGAETCQPKIVPRQQDVGGLEARELDVLSMEISDSADDTNMALIESRYSGFVSVGQNGFVSKNIDGCFAERNSLSKERNNVASGGNSFCHRRGTLSFNQLPKLFCIFEERGEVRRSSGPKQYPEKSPIRVRSHKFDDMLMVQLLQHLGLVVHVESRRLPIGHLLQCKSCTFTCCFVHVATRGAIQESSAYKRNDRIWAEIHVSGSM